MAIIHDPALRYPTEEDYFSPDHRWPEYCFNHLSSRPNPVYAGVRQCLAAASLDLERFETPDWNPFGQFVRPGQNVFLLCNFVEQRVTGSESDFFSKCTHGSVVRAVVDYVQIALKGRGSVAFGNAPLQSADWDAVTRETGATRVRDFYERFGTGHATVKLQDLRQHVIHRTRLGEVKNRYHSDRSEATVSVDLGASSLLEALYADGKIPRFRVLDYDHRRTDRCHAQSQHTYAISPTIMASDVVISIPKLKTHEKVGITCAIKGCVGAVAHKDCLAHHRFGPPSHGGDEMPDRLAPLTLLSMIHDQVYASDIKLGHGILHSVDYFSRKVVRRFTRALSGSWPGNDTCWRMALDLARIIKFANKSGKLQSQSQRTHLMLTDGIIAGEGDGPLSPHAIPFGYLSFSDDIVAGDYANAVAMGFDPDKLPILRNATCLSDYSLSEWNPLQSLVNINGSDMPFADLNTFFARPFKPATEWIQLLAS